MQLSDDDPFETDVSTLLVRYIQKRAIESTADRNLLDLIAHWNPSDLVEGAIPFGIQITEHERTVTFHKRLLDRIQLFHKTSPLYWKSPTVNRTEISSDNTRSEEDEIFQRKNADV